VFYGGGSEQVWVGFVFGDGRSHSTGGGDLNA